MLGDGDQDEELAELFRVSAAPVAATVDDASNRLAALLGGVAVPPRKPRSRTPVPVPKPEAAGDEPDESTVLKSVPDLVAATRREQQQVEQEEPTVLRSSAELLDAMRKEPEPELEAEAQAESDESTIMQSAADFLADMRPEPESESDESTIMQSAADFLADMRPEPEPEPELEPDDPTLMKSAAEMLGDMQAGSSDHADDETSGAVPEAIHDRDMISDAERAELYHSHEDSDAIEIDPDDSGGVEIIDEYSAPHAVPAPIHDDAMAQPPTDAASAFEIVEDEPAVESSEIEVVEDENTEPPGTDELDDALDTALSTLDELLDIQSSDEPLPVIEETAVGDEMTEEAVPAATPIEIADSALLEERPATNVPDGVAVSALAPDELDSLDLSRPGNDPIDLANFADPPETGVGGTDQDMDDLLDSITDGQPALQAFPEDGDEETAVELTESDLQIAEAEAEAEDSAEKKGLLRRFFRKG
jgi:hypothetical protein